MDYRIWRIIAFGWMILIFYLSSKSDLPTPSLFWGQDKVAHALIFGMLGFFFLRSLGPWSRKTFVREIFVVTLMVAAYGLSDEVHQFFVPNRDASVADLAADVAGGFLAVLIFRHRAHRTSPTT